MNWSDNALAYYDTTTITELVMAVKSFIVKAPGFSTIKHFAAIIVAVLY